MKSFHKNMLLVLTLVIGVFTVSSCYKKKDTIAIVTVKDGSDQPVGGASVRLYYEGTGGPDSARIDQTASTGADGKAKFNFNDLYKAGQAGFAVLDIYVNQVKDGIIKVEAEKTSEETVQI